MELPTVVDAHLDLKFYKADFALQIMSCVCLSVVSLCRGSLTAMCHLNPPTPSVMFPSVVVLGYCNFCIPV